MTFKFLSISRFCTILNENLLLYKVIKDMHVNLNFQSFVIFFDEEMKAVGSVFLYLSINFIMFFNMLVPIKRKHFLLFSMSFSIIY